VLGRDGLGSAVCGLLRGELRGGVLFAGAEREGCVCHLPEIQH